MVELTSSADCSRRCPHVIVLMMIADMEDRVFGLSSPSGVLRLTADRE